MQTSIFGCRHWALAGVAVAAISSPAWAAEATRTFNIPAQDLSAALEAFGRQSGMDISFDQTDTAGRTSVAVVGAYEPETALRRLVGVNGLIVRRLNATSFTVEAPPAASREGGVASLQDVVVTGSRIRGAPPASPVIRLSQEDMRNAGNANLGDAIRQLPQNFASQSPAVGPGAGDNTNANSSASLNLRGLGPDATLTLLNGRRLAYNGVRQGVDISAIPLDAVDRLEIVTDGASALYGSDAVGGVANIILKRDYDGLSASARFGGAIDGGAAQQQYSLVGGRTWTAGGLIATLNYEDSTAILARQRSYTSRLEPSQIIYPPIEGWNAVVSAHHDLGERFSLGVDATYNARSTRSETPLTTAPYTTSGTAFDADDDSFSVAPNITLQLPGGWSTNASVVIGRDNTRQLSSSFNAGTPGPQQTIKYDNSLRVYEVNAEGPVARLPAGELRLALGGGYREVGLTWTLYCERLSR